MKVTPRQFARAYVESCAGKTHKQIDDITREFLITVRTARAWKLIPAIIAQIQEYADEQEGITPLSIATAHTITEPMARAIAEKVGFKKARITEHVTPDILGGFIARTADTLFDSSLITQLQQFKKHLQS